MEVAFLLISVLSPHPVVRVSFFVNLDDRSHQGSLTVRTRNIPDNCLFLSVDNISKILEKQPCVVMRDGGLNPLYKLMMRNKDPVHDNINIIEVQRLRNGFFTEYQPILPDKQLIDLLKKNGVKIKEGNSINSYHSYFKTSEQLPNILYLLYKKL